MDMQHVDKYQFVATLRETTVDWSLSLELEGGQKHTIAITDGAEVPLLLDLLRKDPSIYFDPKNRRLSTGWNSPGA
ncbi:MAG: hypothetical protein IPM64_02630 [Phycisphaerales bacterium]|nr:hypothetical protein [Phycisphaerales bacterium]